VQPRTSTCKEAGITCSKWLAVRASAKDRRPHENPCLFQQKTSLGLYGTKGEKGMLFTIAAVLVILWVLGMITSVTIGGFIHVLLVIAVIVILIRIIRGNKII
jgi:hypothetical protein